MTHGSLDFHLTAHPASNAVPVERLGGAINRTPSVLRVEYILEGDLSRIAIPPPVEPRAADELWRHTCFELFVAVPGDPGYFEFNFSPSGEWAVYRFSRYRERVGFDAQAAPRIVAGRSGTGAFTLQAEVPCAALPRSYQGLLTVAISAVVEATDGALSYWALRHPADRPDFHHPDAFVLELR